jgi:hypothetical protein
MGNKYQIGGRIGRGQEIKNFFNEDNSYWGFVEGFSNVSEINSIILVNY